MGLLREEIMDWTGAKWTFAKGRHAGKQVVIIGWRNDINFGKVWVGELPNGGEVIFCDKMMAQEMDPKTRRPYARCLCA